MFVTFSPRLSTLTEMPFLLSLAATRMASSTPVPATKRLERRWPRADFSASARRERLSDSEINRALSTVGHPKQSFSGDSRLRRAFGSQEVVSQKGGCRDGTRIAAIGTAWHSSAVHEECFQRPVAQVRYVRKSALGNSP